MRVLLSILFLLLFINSFGQYSNNSYQSNENTLANFSRSATPTLYGAIKAKIVNAGIFSDTTTANLDLALKYYNGATIMTYSSGVEYWVRYNNQWWKVNGSGGGGSGWNLTGNSGTILQG